MAYRNGTYIAFHANGIKEPTESDMKYYCLLQAWKVCEDSNFYFINSHDKTGAVRDSSKRSTLQASLKQRLCNSKNMVLIIGETTKEDSDWVPFEIRYAVDDCAIPIIAAYPGYQYILAPDQLSHLWPEALARRIRSGAARVIHVPFREKPLTDAVNQFSHNKCPKASLSYYSKETYEFWGISLTRVPNLRSINIGGLPRYRFKI